ncbi:MAG: TrbI/VirB10 family protein [Vulcanimicrobiaceae bacterium]
MPRDEFTDVPSPIEEPGFRSIPRNLRVGGLAVGALLLAVGLWAWLFARPASLNAAPQIAQVAQPAVDVESTDSVLATPTPFSVVRMSRSFASRAIAEHFPLFVATPRPAKSRPPPLPAPPPEAAEGMPPSQVATSEVAAVPRVLTSAEMGNARMNLPAEAPAAPAAASRFGPSPAAVQAPSGPHSSFFADKNSDIGYEPEDAPCIVRATSAISARLVTRVDSTLPGGMVKAEIITPLDCASGDEAAPAGAILQGAYDSNTVAGEARLLVVFTRIIFPPSPAHPNGRAYAIGAQSATGVEGETGLGGRVNTHLGSVAGQAILYTLLGAVGTALGNVGNHGTSIGLNGSSVTSQFPSQAERIAPTIYANPGDPVDVVLARDLAMEPDR